MTRVMKRDKAKRSGAGDERSEAALPGQRPESHLFGVRPESRNIGNLYSAESWLDKIRLGFPRVNHW